MRKNIDTTANGNMIGVQSGGDNIEYIYTPANKLAEVKYPDGTYVKYGYDAFGRKRHNQ